MAEGLQSANSVLQEFQNILRPSFGPFGQDVLMKSDTGTMFLSKEGNFVLQHLELKHPIARLIKETVANYHQSTGDFSKTLVLLLAQFTQMLSKEYLQKGTVRTADNVVHTLSSVALSIFKIRDYLGKHLEENSEIFKRIEPSTFTDTFQDRLLEMSFFGHLDTPLKRIFMSLCRGVTGHEQFRYDMFEYVEQQFDNICIPVCGIPFERSTILDGCVVQRDAKPNEFHRENVNFILVAGHSGGNEKNLVYKLSTGAIGDVEIAFHSKLVDVLQRRKITCILTEDAIPNKIESLLSKLSVVLVSHVLLEDLERLAHRYGISVLSELRDVINIADVSKTIGCATFVKSVVIGASRACHLGPRHSQSTATDKACINSIMNIEILLCCPSQGLMTQYQRILRNTFKVLKQSFVTRSNQFVLLPAGGAFEMYISKVLRSYHKNHTTCEMDKNIALMLSKCFMEVPRLLYEASTKIHNKRFLLGLEDAPLSCKTQCIDAFTGDVLDSGSDMVYYEPANSKMKLLSVFLEFSAQLVKIQYVVPVVRKAMVGDGAGDESSDDED